MHEHNFDKHKSAKYLRGKTPVTLVYSETYQTLQDAMKREIQIKKWTKAKKEAVVFIATRKKGSVPSLSNESPPIPQPVKNNVER